MVVVHPHGPVAPSPPYWTPLGRCGQPRRITKMAPVRLIHQKPMENGCTGTEGGKGNQSPWPLLVSVHALDLGSPVCSEPREGPSPQQHTAILAVWMAVPSWNIGIEGPSNEWLWATLSAGHFGLWFLAPVLKHQDHTLTCPICSDRCPQGLEFLDHWSGLKKRQSVGAKRHVDVFRAPSSSWPDRAAWTLVHTALLDYCPR